MQLRVAETRSYMVIDHARGLHECVANGGSHKTKAAFLQITAHGVRLARAARNIPQCAAPVLHRGSSHELPNVSIEAAKLVPHFEKCLRVVDRGGDLEPVAHNSRVTHQSRDVLRAKTRHP